MALQIVVKNSSVSGKEPTAGQLANGEIALNYHADGPFLSCKDTTGTVRRITGVWVNASAPSSPTAGELWLDLSLTPPQLKVYQDSTNNWVSASAVSVASTTVAGVVELSTNAETQTGADTNRAVTPASLQSKISDSTDTTSSTTIASSTAVKAAKDVADAALPKAGGTVSGALQVTGDTTLSGAVICNGTGYLDLPAGTDAERPASPNSGMIRYNTTTSAYEGYSGGSWFPIGVVAPGAITDTQVAANAEIAVSKLADGAARQVLQTDAAGTGVEWTDSIDLPGTLDVTGQATFDSGVYIGGSLVLEGTTADDFEVTIACEPTADRTVTFPDATTTLAGLGVSQSFTGSNSFINSTGQSFRQAATQDGILLRGRAGGTSSHNVELVPATLSASRTLTAPDVSGTLITTGDTATVTNTMLAGSIADSKLNTISTAGKVSGSAITSGTIGGSTAISTSGAVATTSTLAVGQATAASNTDFDLAGTYAQTIVALGGTTIDCSIGNFFTTTINGNTTFSVSNVPSSRSYAFMLELTHASGTITWFSGVIWPGGTAPTLTTSRVHLFMFQTDNGGSTWRASSLINYAS